jgi:hypothetical protein
MAEKVNEEDQSLEGKGSNICILDRKLRAFQHNLLWSIGFEGGYIDMFVYIP